MNRGSPVNILYSHNSEKIGGGNKVLLGLFSKLDRERYQPWSLLPCAGPMEDELRKLEVPYLVEDAIGCSTSGGRLANLRTFTSLLLKMARTDFSLFHAQGPLSYRLVSLLPSLARVKRICHLHSPANDLETLSWAFKVKPHQVIACSRHVANSYHAAVGGRSIDVPGTVLHNFVDETAFTPSPPSLRLRSELAITGSAPVVTIIGMVNEKKGHPEFLAMARMLLQTRKDVRFLVVGEDILTAGAYRRKMEGLAESLGIGGCVSFLGFRSDVADIISLSDLIVFPSHEEGMPMTILEVGACAKSTVAYRIPGVDELLVDGKNGLLVEENDVAALARAVDRLLADPPLRQSLGEAARSMVEERFTLARYASRMQGIYHDLLELS